MAQSAEDRIKLPGFGLPINHMPDHRYQNAIVDFSGHPLTVRERLMTYFIDTITDKPDWESKVYDEEIVEKWRKEALFPDTGNFSKKMFDYVSYGTFLNLAA